MISCCSIELGEIVITIGFFFFRNTSAPGLRIKITVTIRAFTA